MWVWVDRAGFVLFDSALSTAIVLSLAVLAMLVCRQPARRLQIARAALVASLVMIPLVALVPLPQFDLLAAFSPPERTILQAVVRSESTPSPALALPATRRTTGGKVSRALLNRAPGFNGWGQRSLVLIDLACMATSFAWLLLGFWGIHWILRPSRDPSRGTQELYNQLDATEAPARQAALARLVTSPATGPGRHSAAHDRDPPVLR